jgi:hypothetical protein
MSTKGKNQGFTIRILRFIWSIKFITERPADFISATDYGLFAKLI